MPTLTIPLIAATAFTVGGYAILKLERQAEHIGECLFAAFAVIALVTGGMTLSRVAPAHYPRPTAELAQPERPHTLALSGQAISPAYVPMN